MLRLAEIFTHGAILQRGKPIRFRGEASEHAALTLQLHGVGAPDAAISLGASADDAGQWQAECPAQEAGGPYTLVLTSGPEMLVVEDLFFGDVFLLAGQSNMHLPLSRTLDAMPKEYQGSDFAGIREWTAEQGWQKVSSETSALGLSTALEYRKKHDVPVGLLHVAKGGTPIESWLPLDDLRDQPEVLATYEAFKDPEVQKSFDERYEREIAAWLSEADQGPSSAWEPIMMPQMFFETRFEKWQGSLWLRFSFDLNADDLAKFREDDNVRLDLGAFKDHDKVWLNGHLVGETTYQYPPRKYPISAELLQLGQNDVLIRLFVFQDTGGAVPGKFYGLLSKRHILGFPYVWEVAEGKQMPEAPRNRFWDRLASANYTEGILPLQGLGLRAVLWYQGESNAGQESYLYLFPRLIFRYRAVFGQDMLFVFVQLPNFQDPARNVPEFSWAMMREQQRRASALTCTAMVVSVDIGEANDLHPQDKWTLGKRIALALEGIQSPRVLKANNRVKAGIIIKVDQEGLRGSNMASAFEVRRHGEWLEDFISDVYILGNGIYLLTKEEGSFEEVRYLYRNNPAPIWIRNPEGLPLTPFILTTQQ